MDMERAEVYEKAEEGQIADGFVRSEGFGWFVGKVEERIQEKFNGVLDNNFSNGIEENARLQQIYLAEIRGMRMAIKLPYGIKNAGIKAVEKLKNFEKKEEA